MHICSLVKFAVWPTNAFSILAGAEMRPDMFYPSALGEGRILLLIDRFTTPKKCLEGRTKLAKLDFFLRYPSYLSKALDIIGAGPIATSETETDNIECNYSAFWQMSVNWQHL